jgi:hypothetical protein
MEDKRLTQIDLDRLSDDQPRASPGLLPGPFRPPRTPTLRTLSHIPHYGKGLVRGEKWESPRNIPANDGLDHLLRSESGPTTHEPPTMLDGFPWEKYESDNYERDLAGWVTVAVRRADPCELVAVKELPRKHAADLLPIWDTLWHENVVTVLDLFRTDEAFYVVLEHTAISLHQIVRSPRYPNETQLAAILGQVRADVRVR